jgi:D-alanyl-lipoteichoic acid acyltransferase DltB (MBOAT superfamily)
MLFNSVAFIFGFFPITVIGFFWLARSSMLMAAAWLTAASLFFYGWWNPIYVLLLAASIVFNYVCGYALARLAQGPQKARLAWPLLVFAVVANLALLGYFKYANFFLQVADGITQSSAQLGHVVLPLGISFFTFTQIAFLVDVYRGYAREYNPVHYALFVTYFPHLIAGPVLHHKEMMPQFQEPKTYRLDWNDVAVGVTIFFLGLFKKSVIADGVAPYAAPLFAAPAQPDLLAAWGGALAYTFQLYFDFSGYSDMAIGLSRVLGVKLPLNFDSPYKAVNIIEFWRRWHMTLSRFLRDYLYFPLGGNRKGRARRYANLMTTMVLGGLWHGAGWTFIAWGALHGAYLVVNHAWRAIRTAFGQNTEDSTRLGRVSARLVTFVAVVIGWVFFRASSFHDSVQILAGMAGANGIAIPEGIAVRLGPLQQLLQQWGVRFYLGGGSQFVVQYAWILILLPFTMLAPNTQEFLVRFQPALDLSRSDGAIKLEWRPSPAWAAAMALVAAVALLSLSRVSAFLYYQF